MSIDHQNQKPHNCRICKKAFASGRALGGHMRAHAINDEPIPDPTGSKWAAATAAAGAGDDDGDLSPPSSPKRNKRTRHGEEEDLAETGEPSHQALGGHRATHKKVKGCFAARRLKFDAKNEFLSENTPLTIVPLRKNSKFHECSVCKREFLTGQALGGHKRCHWGTSKIGKFSGAAAIAAGGENGIPLRFEVPVAIYLQSIWNNGEVKEKAINGGLDGEVERKEVKLVNLSGLNEGEERSTWLQIGIGSTAEF